MWRSDGRRFLRYLGGQRNLGRVRHGGGPGVEPDDSPFERLYVRTGDGLGFEQFIVRTIDGLDYEGTFVAKEAA
jgi:hypothetical protein